MVKRIGMVKVLLKCLLALGICWSSLADNYITIDPAASKANLTEIEQLISDFTLVPSVFPEAPKKLLYVVYSGNKKVDPGRMLEPMAVRDAPLVRWTPINDTYYTLLMIDPDTPDCSQRDYLHWLLVNIPEDNMLLGDLRAAYVGAMPPQYSGRHRYTFLLYQQPQYIKFTIPKVGWQNVHGRLRFNTTNFAERHQLGTAIAFTMFRSEFTSSVIDLYNSIKGTSH